MRIKKSESHDGWIGFYLKDEHGYPEEFLSIKTIEKVQKIVNQLQEDIKKFRR